MSWRQVQTKANHGYKWPLCSQGYCERVEDPGRMVSKWSVKRMDYGLFTEFSYYGDPA